MSRARANRPPRPTDGCRFTTQTKPFAVHKRNPAGAKFLRRAMKHRFGSSRRRISWEVACALHATLPNGPARVRARKPLAGCVAPGTVVQVPHAVQSF